MLTIPVEEVGIGDYSSDYGTVVATLVDAENGTIKLFFKNGTDKTFDKETELEIHNGGRFNHPTEENDNG